MIVLLILVFLWMAFVLSCMCIASSNAKDLKEEDQAQKEFLSNYLKKKTNRV